MSALLKAYGLGMSLLQPLAPTILKARVREDKEDPDRLGERLGRPSLPRPAGPLLWLHGASVGETLSLLPLVEALDEARPDLTLLVTSGTVTSAHMMERRLPSGVIHQYLPLDTPAFARRFIGHWKPDLTLFVESELWPSLLQEAKASGSKLALLGARLSQDSAQGWGSAKGAARAVLGLFDLILAQDDFSRRRLEALGAVVAGELDLKQAAGVLPCDEDELAALKAAIGSRPVLVGASTHPGEDEILSTLLTSLTRSALLILVPRHPERGQAIANMLERRGLRVARRSEDEPITPGIRVYLADTLGELGLFLRLAQVVVMGGSLMGGVGGHNPLEPARLGLPIVTGADTANFRQAYAGLLEAHAALQAPDEPGLVLAVADLMAHPARAREIGLRAKALEERGGRTLDRALKALEPLLPPPGVSA